MCKVDSSYTMTSSWGGGGRSFYEKGPETYTCKKKFTSEFSGGGKFSLRGEGGGGRI